MASRRRVVWTCRFAVAAEWKGLFRGNRHPRHRPRQRTMCRAARSLEFPAAVHAVARDFGGYEGVGSAFDSQRAQKFSPCRDRFLDESLQSPRRAPAGGSRPSLVGAVRKRAAGVMIHRRVKWLAKTRHRIEKILLGHDSLSQTLRLRSSSSRWCIVYHRVRLERCIFFL